MIETYMGVTLVMEEEKFWVAVSTQLVAFPPFPSTPQTLVPTLDFQFTKRSLAPSPSQRKRKQKRNFLLAVASNLARVYDSVARLLSSKGSVLYVCSIH